MKKTTIFLFMFCLLPWSLNAQTARDHIRRGNRLMLDTIGGKDFSEKAIVQYQKALELDSTISIAHYNLGNSMIRQNKPQDAMKSYLKAAKYEKDKQRLSDIYHNMGVLLQASEKYAEAVEAYKESLRNDPSNDETRYNYVLAKWHLKNQPQDNQNQQGGQNNQDQQQDKQQQDQQQQPQQDKKDEQKQQPEKENMSQENAERLLKAAMRNEKETQEKIQRQQQETPRRRLQKQW